MAFCYWACCSPTHWLAATSGVRTGSVYYNPPGAWADSVIAAKIGAGRHTVALIMEDPTTASAGAVFKVQWSSF